MENTVKLHPSLDSINSVDVAGVKPNSLRYDEDVIRVDARLKTSQQFNFDLSALSLSRAIVGHTAQLIVTCSVKKSDGSAVAFADPISLREEASSMVWRDITLTINGVEISHGIRADVVRHFVDRFHQNSRLLGLTNHRQLGPDNNLLIGPGLAETGIFKKDMIHDGARFELLRPLTDLPMFSEGDSFIPAFNTVRIKATTTSDPQILFKTDGTIAASPYIQIEEVRLRYATVELEELVAQSLQQSSAAGELEITGSLWAATNITPRVDSGARSYRQGTATAYSTSPDLVYFALFPESSFIPDTTAYRTGRHPMERVWAGMSAVTFRTGGGEAIRAYRDIDNIGGKVKLLQAARESIASQGGMVEGSGSLADVGAIADDEYVAARGTGAVPLMFRNWAELNTHKINPLTLRVEATLVSTEASQPYLISKTRHRWVLSTVPGATKLVV